MSEPQLERELTTDQRDLTELGARLAAWLDAEVTAVDKPHGGGMSSVTLLFEADGRPMVARLAPEHSAYPVFPSYDLRRQYDVMAGVAAHSRVPVPVPVDIDETGDALGSPCLVMERVDGRVPADNPPYVFDGWLYDASVADRRQLQDDTVRLLAGIHAIEDPCMPFPVLAAEAGDDPLRAHVEGQRAYYEWTRRDDGLRIPVLERGFDWLEAHWPEQTGDPVLSWGDARIGNVIYDGFAPVAVLDWEMAALGPRELDLGWMLYLHRFFQDLAEFFALPGLPDFHQRGDVVAAYTAAAGLAPADLAWYLVYAALRHGIVMSRIKRRMIHFGEEQAPDDVDDYVMHRASLERLLDGSYVWPGA